MYIVCNNIMLYVGIGNNVIYIIGNIMLVITQPSWIIMIPMYRKP